MGRGLASLWWDVDAACFVRNVGRGERWNIRANPHFPLRAHAERFCFSSLEIGCAGFFTGLIAVFAVPWAPRLTW
jgi:hypothetical protein